MKIFTFFLYANLFSFNVTNLYLQEYYQNNSLPVIDGKINPSEWKNAKVFTDFYIFLPKSDKKDYDSTIVYVKQSKDALYFAFKFFPKEKVISQSLVRDRSSDEENEFFIFLDLENKNQNGYFFAFNFIGNQRDMLIYNQKNVSQEWDWIWENKSTIYREATATEPGYIETEVKIPVDKIQNKNTEQIGINFTLFAYRPDGTYYFYSIVPNNELMSLKKTYKMNITPFDERLNININATPFLMSNKFNDSTYKANGGGELSLSLDKHKLKATYNTDESTLEADPYSFSFYNRPIYLEEKRLFFSKDLDIYRSQINLFYTRAIENINYGFNYTYRSSKFKAGAIFVEDDPESSGNTRQFFTTRPVFYGNNFNFGGFFLHSNKKADNYKENILSFDGLYYFPSNPLRFAGQYATNFNGNAYKLVAAYQNNNNSGPYGSFSYNKVDDKFKATTSFNPNVGLVNNYDEISATGGYAWIIERPLFSGISINTGYYRSRALNDNFKMQESIYMNFYTKITGTLSFNGYTEYNQPNDFDEFGNITKRNNYINEFSLRYLTGNNAFFAGYMFGPYYTTYIKNPYFGGNIILGDKIALNGSVNFYDMYDIKRTIINARMDFRILKQFYLRSFFRKDTYSQNALLNTMLQYEFFAGSNIYLVMNLEGKKLQYVRRYFKIGYEFNF
jgi:hypothetical protein